MYHAHPKQIIATRTGWKRIRGHEDEFDILIGRSRRHMRRQRKLSIVITSVKQSHVIIFQQVVNMLCERVSEGMHSDVAAMIRCGL